MPQVLNQSYDQLVEKAQVLFWTRGYKGVNAKELANCLDVSTSIIYNKFTKDMLFMDSLGYYTANYSDPFLKQLRETTEGLDSLKDFFYTLIDALLDKTFPKSCLMVNTVVEMRNTNKEISDVYQRYFETLTNSYKVVLDKAIDLGQVKYPEKKDAYAEFLLGIIFSVSILYKIQSKEQLRNFIDEQISLIE